MLKTVVYIYVLLALVTRIIRPDDQKCSCDQPDSKFADGVNLVYYTCNNTTLSFPVTTPQGLLDVLEKDKRTIVYIFGYLENPDVENVWSVMQALCYGRTDNVVLLDWSKYSVGDYANVFQNGEKVGSLFARSIRLLKDNGFDVSKLYVVAHSLGAHIAGFAGKCNNFTIPRITGLDPANPLFYIHGCYLTPKDAAWIDIIHTDMYVYGAPQEMGTTEYYVNSGIRPQPGCNFINVPLSQDDFCSHQRSVKLYIKSKYHPDEFNAIQCASLVLYKLNRCNKNLQNGIGYAATNVPGFFYINTGFM